MPGTKAYMAPEQLNKDNFPLTDDFSKLDVWALGVFLIHMLTHEFAFESPSDSDNYEFFMNDPIKFFH